MAQGNIHIGLTAEDLRARLHILTALLIVFGLTALYSISDNPLSIESSFMRQFIFMILSFIVYLILRRVSLKAFHDNSTMIFLFTIGLCLVPFFLPRVEYTYRWIDLGFMTIQPSEYLKIGVIIAIAKYLSNHQLEMKTKSIVVIPGLLTLFGAAIVLRQPDLGTAAIVCAPLIPMLLWAGVNGFVLFLIIAPLITIIAASNSIAFSIWAVIMLLCFLLASPGVVTGFILYFVWTDKFTTDDFQSYSFGTARWALRSALLSSEETLLSIPGSQRALRTMGSANPVGSDLFPAAAGALHGKLHDVVTRGDQLGVRGKNFVIKCCQKKWLIWK